jgi:hypothetical protein
VSIRSLVEVQALARSAVATRARRIRGMDYPRLPQAQASAHIC